MTSIALLYCAPPGERGFSTTLSSQNATGSQELRARDDALVRAIRSGDERAFQTLFESHIEGLLRFATSYLHDLEAAREVVDDVFLKVWDRKTAWAPEHGAAVYLYGAVRNRALNYQRSSRRRDKVVEAIQHDAQVTAQSNHPARPDEQLEQAEVASLVWGAIDALPEPRRQAVILRWKHGMSAPEIAKVLGVSQGAVYQLLNRAHELLYRLLSPVFR